MSVGASLPTTWSRSHAHAKNERPNNTMAKPNARRNRRSKLLTEIACLAEIAIFGSISETFRTCGNAGCRCHGEGPKHGPHVYVSFRADGKTTGYYVPKAAHD